MAVRLTGWISTALFVPMECAGTDRNGYARHLFVSSNDVVNKELWKLFPTINVDKIADIPKDYPGPMGVPITFMSKYAVSQFELLDCTHNGFVHGRQVYVRLIVRNLKPELPEYIDLAEWFDRMGVPLEIEIEEAEDEKR